MAWFYSRYYKTKTTPYIHKPLERFTISEARERRLAADLARNTELQSRFGRRADALFPGRNESALLRKLFEDAKSERPKADARSAARVKALRTEIKLEASRRLRQREGLQNAKAAASDRREYHPDGRFRAQNIYGSAAKTGLFDRRVFDDVRRGLWLANNFAIPRFLNPNAVVPCIQRHVRREVLFARKKAGRGYRTPKRRGPNSGVPC